MSDQNSSSSLSVKESGNGGPAVSVGEGEGEGQASQQPQQQQQRRSGWDMLRTVLFQIMIFYFISSFFRGRQTPPQNPDGTTPLAGSNLFNPGLELVRTVLCSKVLCCTADKAIWRPFTKFTCALSLIKLSCFMCYRIWRCISRNLRTLISTPVPSIWCGKRECSMGIGLTGLWVMAADRKSWTCPFPRLCRRMGHGTSTCLWWREICRSIQRKRVTRRQPSLTSQSVCVPHVQWFYLYENVCIEVHNVLYSWIL